MPRYYDETSDWCCNGCCVMIYNMLGNVCDFLLDYQEMIYDFLPSERIFQKGFHILVTRV